MALNPNVCAINGAPHFPSDGVNTAHFVQDYCR